MGPIIEFIADKSKLLFSELQSVKKQPQCLDPSLMK